MTEFSRGSSVQLTPHFKRREFDCKCGCKTTLHDPDLSERLEKMRVLLDESITISSGFRCSKHNKAVGGSPGSKHVTGEAADIVCKAVNPVLLGIVARKYFSGVGVYWYGNTAFVHVDTRPNRVTWLKSLSSESYRYTSSGSFIMPTIKKGSTGAVNKAAIRMLQRLLGITVDGNFGSGTEKALKDAQKKAGITSDGICGPESWKYISGAIKFI